MLIRQARRSDIEQMAEVLVSSWHTTYRGILPDDFINARTVESRIRNISKLSLMSTISLTSCIGFWYNKFVASATKRFC